MVNVQEILISWGLPECAQLFWGWGTSTDSEVKCRNRVFRCPPMQKPELEILLQKDSLMLTPEVNSEGSSRENGYLVET